MIEKRKVRQNNGGKDGSSLIITIPKKICQELSIEAGNWVTVDVQGQTIHVNKDI